jgi:hypothetical protein
MLVLLRVQEHNQEHNIAAEAGSWFYYEYLRDHLWISIVENAPDNQNRTIATEKCVLTAFWNPD